MRNGNIATLSAYFVLAPVLTVPMRNGNTKYLIIFQVHQLVLTVPMRNGNSVPAFGATHECWFLPYL